MISQPYKNSKTKAQCNFRALDLFAGAGGLGLGLARAGFAVVAANEFQEVFCKTYSLNHPATKVICGDIMDAKVRHEICNAAGVIDLIAGGPPCQGFSTVGSKNERDLRNGLFYAFIKMIDELRPRAVMFENVSGFQRMYDGRAFNALRQGLECIGYSVPDKQCQLLNAMHFGVPQNRLRTFVIAFRDQHNFDFPQPTHSLKPDLFGSKTALTLEEALSDLPIVQMGESATRYASPPKNDFQRTARDGMHSDVLTEQDGPWHGEKLMNMIRHVPIGGTIADVPAQFRPKAYFSNTYARLWWARPSTTITRNLGTPSSSRCIHPMADRGLTTREGARLQGFPDTYQFTGTRSEKNLQIGNAVPPILAAAVASRISLAILGGSPRAIRVKMGKQSSQGFGV